MNFNSQFDFQFLLSLSWQNNVRANIYVREFVLKIENFIKTRLY